MAKNRPSCSSIGDSRSGVWLGGPKVRPPSSETAASLVRVTTLSTFVV
ncbi:hypothetical protein ACFQ0B_59110 [Nonomuraea thailandensis]